MKLRSLWRGRHDEGDKILFSIVGVQHGNAESVGSRLLNKRLKANLRGPLRKWLPLSQHNPSRVA